LYELEVKTDLGDSMVRVTEAEFQAMQTDFNIVLAWEKMDVLTSGNSMAPGETNGLPPINDENSTGNTQ